MQKGIALVTYVHEACVESWHQFANFGQIDVAYGEVFRASFLLELDEFLVFEKGYGNLLLADIDDYFACHVRMN